MSEVEGPVDTGTGADESVDQSAGDAASESHAEGGQKLNNTDAAAVQKAVKSENLPPEMLDRVVTVNVDGEEQTMTVRELGRLQSLERASQKRLEQASIMGKKVQAFAEALQKNPAEALKRAGHDPEKFAEEFLRRKIAEMQMSPEQRQHLEERQKLDEERKQFNHQAETRMREEIDHQMTVAFKDSGLPKSPFLAARVAMAVAQSIERTKGTNEKPLSYKEAAGKVKTWFENSTRESMKNLDPDGILKFLGPELVKKLQQALVSQIKGTAPTSSSTQTPSPTGGQAQSKQKPKEPFRHWKDYQKYVDSL